MEKYYTFHQEAHSEKTCAQWKHNMNVVVANAIEILIVEEHFQQTEEIGEPTLTEKSSNESDSIFTFDLIFNSDRKGVGDTLVGDAPPQQPAKKYNLRRKRPVPKKYVRKQLLRKILPPSNPAHVTQKKSRSTQSQKSDFGNNKNKSTTPEV